MTQFSCYGKLLIQESFESKKIVEQKNNLKSSNSSSYKMSLSCYSYVSTLEKGQLIEIKTQIKTEQTSERIVEKNLYKNIKNSVCSLSGNVEASKVRKRLIGIYKIYGSVSGKDFSFKTC